MYSNLENSLNQLVGVDKNQLEYLTLLHKTLMEYYVLISTDVGKMKAKAMLLETAKGRADLGLNNQQVIDFFGEYYKANAYLELINKISIITQQKVKIMTEK